MMSQRYRNARRAAVEAAAKKSQPDPSKVIVDQSVSPHFIEFTMADGSTIEISVDNGWRSPVLCMETGRA